MKIPKFKNEKILEQVFMHRSFLNETSENVASNERLEFLGDSVLSLVVSSYIFNQHKNSSEGQLTNIRSVLTNTETLYEVGRSLNLGDRLIMSKGEEQSGGRINKTILANTYEAVIGGLYLDQGLAAVAKFIETTLLSQADELIKTQGLKDPKSKLQEKLQETYRNSPTYKVLTEEGPDHNKLYTVGVYIEEKLLAEGTGPSKQDAEKAAARSALGILLID